MFELLLGIKTAAFFDVWAIEHFLTGISIGHVVRKSNRKHVMDFHPWINRNHKGWLRFDIMGVLFLAYLWEAFEHYLEAGLAGSGVAYWFQGVEFWGNRLLADPLLLVFGYFVAWKFPRWVIPARIFSIAWLVVHIFLFPHSMYLHYLG